MEFPVKVGWRVPLPLKKKVCDGGVEDDTNEVEGDQVLRLSDSHLRAGRNRLRPARRCEHQFDIIIRRP